MSSLFAADQLLHHWQESLSKLYCCQSFEKDVYRREGKDRRCCLGDRIDIDSWRSKYFAPGRFEE